MRAKLTAASAGVLLALSAAAPAAAASGPETAPSLRSAPAPYSAILAAYATPRASTPAQPLQSVAARPGLPAGASARSDGRLPDGNVDFCAGPGHQ